MEKFEVKLLSKGDITLLPDSQKLFGFLINELKNKYDEDKIDDFVSKVKKNEITCNISNLIPTGYLPTPKEFILDKISLTEEKNRKEIYKIIKKMDYIKVEDLKEILNNEVEKDFLKNLEYVKEEQSYVQKLRIESQFLGMAGYPNKAYSLPVVSYRKYNKNELIKEFSFFIKVEDGSILFEYIKDKCGKTLNETAFLGAKASYGYNKYEIISINNDDNYKGVNQCNTYLNIGMLLLNNPKNIDWEKSYLRLYTSDRKSYLLADRTDKVISFIDEGSVISLSKNLDIEYVGKNINNKYNVLVKNAIVFGNSFLEELI